MAAHYAPLVFAMKLKSGTQAGAEIALAILPGDLCTTLGVTDPEVASRLLSQLLGVLRPDTAAPIDPALINEALALLRDIAPTDAVEAMLAVMLVAAQHAGVDTMRRAVHPAQSPAGRQSYLALSLKAMRTFAQLMETLNYGRGKGVTQRVIVERVNVEAGGQAIVGAVAAKGEGG